MRLKHLDAVTTIAFDADDTLWVNEDIFMAAQQSFIAILQDYHDETYIQQHLSRVQLHNLQHFGYGIKGFTLSMIETAIELTEGRITGREIHDIIRLAKHMLQAPIHVLPAVEDVLERLQGRYQLMLITKGDLLDQEGKLSRSGLANYFDLIEVVSEKDVTTYRNLLQRYQIEPSTLLMLGNSLKSDIVPLLEIGAHAIHVPYRHTWSHELVSEQVLAKYPEIVTLSQIDQVLPLLGIIDKKEVV